MLLNNNSLIMQWNRDESGNPASIYIPREVQQVSPTHGVIQLVQVPDQHQRIKIVTEDNVQLNEVFNIEDITAEGFYVDYGVGIVRFHESLQGKMLLISYYGRGVILISDSRIFHRDGENITDTWDNILARSQGALDLIESAGGLVEAMEQIDQKVEEGNVVIGRLEDFITETQFYGYTIALSREAFVVKAKEDGEVSKSEVQSIFTDVLVYQGAKQIIPKLSIEQQNGCVFKIEGQRVKLSSIDINFIKANAVLNIDCGDGLIAKRTLEVTKVFDGVSQYSVEMTNAFYSFEANSEGYIENEESITCNVAVTKANIDYKNYTITVQGAPQGLRYTVGADSVTFTSAKGSALPSYGSCLVVVTIDGVAHNKSFTWNKTRKGQDAKSLTLIGSQILRYETSDYSDVPNPSRSTITAKTVGLSGSPKWYVQNGSEWTLLEGQIGTELVFPHNDVTIWGSRKETTIKCELEGYEDEITLVKLATGVNGMDAITVVLTNESHTVAIDNSGEVHELEIANARTNVLAYKGIREVTPVLSKGECVGCDIKFVQNTAQLISLDNSFSTATANINVTVDGVTVVKTWTISKAKQGSNGATGADGSSYILNITEGTRSFTYSQINLDPRPATSTTFVGTLYENGNEIVEGVSYYWVANGHLEGSSIKNTFTPTIKSIFDESILNNDVQLAVSYKGMTITQTVPVAITKDANGLDWVQEWDDTKTDVRGNLILTPKLFAGSYDQENDLVTGVAIGKDVLNNGTTIGVAGYQNNKTTFLLDTDGTFMVGNPFEEGSTGMYFDGDSFTLKVNQLSIEGASVPTTDDLTSAIDREVNSAKEEVKAEISQVVSQVVDLDSYMNNALKDGILDEVERAHLDTLYENISSEVIDVASQHRSVANNPYFTDEAIQAVLTERFDAYMACYLALTEIFTKIIESEIILGEDVETFRNTIANFKECSGDLQQSLTDALTSISEVQTGTIVAQAKEEIKKEIDGVSDSLTDLENTMNGSFKSGLISTINLTNLRSKLSQLETEKSDVDGQYKALIENSKLGATTRTLLANAKSELDTAHDQLIAKITSAISDMLMTEQELADINRLISIYVTKLGLYSEVAQKANADIALNLAQGVVEALDQEAIFNKLTNNGEVQGIYLQNKKVYINGEYINTRNFKAVRDDGTETFKIDSRGDVIGRFKSFYLTGDDTNIPTIDYVDDEVSKIKLGNLNVVLSNEAQVIPTTNRNMPLSNQLFSTSVKVYMGVNEVSDFTIGAIANANGITVSIDQAAKTVMFSVKDNVAITKDSGSFTIPIVTNGKTYNKQWTWAVSKQGNDGVNGTTGKDAQYVVVNGEQVFKYTNNFTGNPTPSSITLTATKFNTTGAGKWQYKSTSGTWIDWTVSGVVQTGATLTVPHTGFNLATQKSMSVRYIVGSVYDEITLVKVSDGTNGINGTNGTNGKDGKDGKDGESAKYAIVNGEQVFKYSNNFTGNPVPTNISLTTVAYNIPNPTYVWQFKRVGETVWTTISGATSNSYSLSHNNTTIFNNSNVKAVTLKCTVSGIASDEITIVKVSDGSNGVNGTNGTNGVNGQDAYTVVLSNESHTFPSNSGGNITSALSTTVTAIGFKGATSITPTIGTLPTVTGLTLSKSGANVTIQANTGTSLADMGTLTIPVIIDGKTFNKVFSWTKTKAGANGTNGTNGKGVSTITEYYLATSASSGVTTSTSGWTTTVQSMTTTNKYLWNYEVIRYTDNSTTTTTPVIIGVHGNNGTNGATGNGIKAIVNYYLATSASSGVTTSTSGWTTTVQTMTSTNKHLWNYEVIQYTNNTSYTGTPRIIGVYGAKGDKGDTGSTGATGTGIASITEEYYLSTSKTTQTGGSWTPTPPTWSTGRYMWTRSKIVYTNPSSTKYTNPICDSSWEAVNEIQIDGANLLKNSNFAKGKTNWSGGGTVDTTVKKGNSNSLLLYKSGATTDTWTAGIQKIYEAPSNGDEFTISCWYYVKDRNKFTRGFTLELKGSTKTVGATELGLGSTSIAKENLVVGKWTRISTTVKITRSDLLSVSFHPYIYRDGEVWLTELKAEKGNKVTGWTVAPEDVQEEINGAVAKVDVMYYLSTSQTSLNGGAWSTTAPQWVNGKYMWSKTVTTLKSGKVIESNPTCIAGAKGDKGDKGNDGINGTNGTNGQDAITIVLSNETHTFPCENNGNIPSALTTSCTVTAYKGATTVAPTIGSITNPNGMTITKSGATLTIQANAGASLADTGSVNIPITVDGKTFTKTFSWSKAKKGAVGANGANGANAKTVDILATSQVFKSTDGGVTFSPNNITLTPKFQSVSYSNWQYSTNGGSNWTTVTSGQNGLTISGSNLTISKSSALYTQAVTSIVFRVNTSDSSVYDTMTITRLYDVVELNVGTTNFAKMSKTFANMNSLASGGWSVSASSDGFSVLGITTEVTTWVECQMDVYPTYNSLTEKVTISFEYKESMVGVLSFNFGAYNNTTRVGEIYNWVVSSDFKKEATSDGWTRVWLTFDATKANNITNANNYKLQFKKTSGKTGTVSIRKVKFESGTIPTSWSLAPQDVDIIAQQKVDLQTQLSIFNKLTNNGQKQGLYIENDKIYLNGEYIKAGTINADKLIIGIADNGGYSVNSGFTNWTSAYPYGTSAWQSGGISKVTVDGKNVVQFTCSDVNKDCGMALENNFFAKGVDLTSVQYICIEAKVRLTSGTSFNGSAILLDVYRTDNSCERLQLNLNQLGTVAANTWYTIRKIFKLSDANVAKTFLNLYGYVLGNWGSAGAKTAKTIQFANVNFYHATQQDYLTQTWTSGTQINGGSIATNSITADKLVAKTITADKLAVGDFTNYAELNVNTASKYGFTKESDEVGGAWLRRTNMSRDILISDYCDCNGGETFRLKGDISTTIKGSTINGGTDSAFLGTAIGIFAYDGTGKNVGYLYGERITNASKSVSSTVTLPSTARRFRVYIQTEGWGNWSGTLKVRNIQIIKMANAELIVNGSITSDKIVSRAITADKIHADVLSANNIVSIINGGSTTISGNKITTGSITADMITSGTFKGTNFEAGGNGNSGLFLAKDSSNNVVFSASKNGVYATNLTFVDKVNFDGTFRTSASTRMNSTGYDYSVTESNSSYSYTDSLSFTGTTIMTKSVLSRFDGTGGTSSTVIKPDSIKTTGDVVASRIDSSGIIRGASFEQSSYGIPIEIGKYIDMHQTGSNTDVDVRIEASGRQGIRIERGDDLSQYVEIGVGTTDRYFYNSTSGKYFTLKNDGRLAYDGYTVPHNWKQNFSPFIYSDTGRFNMAEGWGEAVYLGDLVWIRGRVRGSRGGHSGSIYIGGLPVSCNGGYPALNFAFFGGVTGNLGGAGFDVRSYIEGNAAHAFITYSNKDTGGWHNLQCSHVTTGHMDISFSATYKWR